MDQHPKKYFFIVKKLSAAFVSLEDDPREGWQKPACNKTAVESVDASW